jgi:urease gamma subunit
VGTASLLVAPHDLTAEAAVLGALLLEGSRAVPRVAAVLSPADFYTDAHGTIFSAILELHRDGHAIDVITVANAMRRSGAAAMTGGDATLAVLVEQASIAAHLHEYAQIVADAARRRRFLALGERLVDGATNGATSRDLIGWTEALLADDRHRVARTTAEEPPSELNALLAHRFPPRAELIARGILPRGGLLLFGGAPKLGKSLLLLNLLLQRARGLPALNFPTDPGVSLIVQSELPAEAYVGRVKAMLAHDVEPVPEGRLHIKSRRGVMLDQPEGLALISAWIEETGADLVGIDPLARHMAGDENSNRDMSAVVRAVDALIERYGVSVAIVHHPSKPREHETREGGMRLRGGSALFGAADTVIMMDRADDGFLLQFELRHGAAIDPIRVVRTDDLWFIVAGPDPELLAVAGLTAPAPLTYNVLVAAGVEDLKLSKATAKRRVAAALAVGLLEKDADGLYRPGRAFHLAGSQSHGVSPDE